MEDDIKPEAASTYRKRAIADVNALAYILENGDSGEQMDALECLHLIAAQAQGSIDMLRNFNPELLSKYVAQKKNSIHSKGNRTAQGQFFAMCLIEMENLRKYPRSPEKEQHPSVEELPALTKSSLPEWTARIHSWMEWGYSYSYLTRLGPLWEVVQGEAKTIRKKDQGYSGYYSGDIEDENLLSRGLRELIRKWLSYRCGSNTAKK